MWECIGIMSTFSMVKVPDEKGILIMLLCRSLLMRAKMLQALQHHACKTSFTIQQFGLAILEEQYGSVLLLLDKMYF
jgi:hypothetical protein